MRFWAHLATHYDFMPLICGTLLNSALFSRKTRVLISPMDERAIL
jgi:hypothetical protein